MKIRKVKAISMIMGCLLLVMFLPPVLALGYSYPHPDTYNPGRQKTQIPGVNTIKAGDVAVTGSAETGAMIKVFDGDGYSIGQGYAYSGRFTVPTRKLKAGEVIQVYAHANLKDESDRVLVYVDGYYIPPNAGVSRLPVIENIYTDTKIIRGRSEPGTKIEMYNGRGYFVASTTANQYGNFEFTVNNLAAGEVLQFYATEIGKTKTPNPVKVSVIDNRRYIITLEGSDRNSIRGRLNTFGYVTVKDSRGIELGMQATGYDGSFRMGFNRTVDRGETIRIFAGPNPRSSDTDLRVIIEDGAKKPNPPVVYNAKVGDNFLKGYSEAYSTIVVKDSNNNEIGRGTSDYGGNFHVNLNRAIVNNENIYIYAISRENLQSEATLVVFKELEKSKSPAVNPVKMGSTMVTGESSKSYDKLTVYDNEGKVLGFNWAGPSGKYTVSLNRGVLSGETIKVTATSENMAESDPTIVIAELIKDTTLRISYIKGYPDGSVKPGNTLSRAEAAAMFARLLNNSGEFETSNITAFPDANQKWYSKAVNYIVLQGYMKGYPNGKFLPDKKITRAEFAQMISQYDNQNDVVAEFSDTYGHWAKKAIDKSYGNGRIKGYPDGSFKPNADITRAEAATILNSLFKRKTDKDSFAELSNPGAMNKFRDIDTSHWAYYDLIDAGNSHKSYRRDSGEIVENWTEITN